ncbi:MAG: type II secretion system F family protein [Candidatus Omnitrophica bacterium]|nr:type II secretion system F family protein [Candidatus Omnitrophota bacterium]
MPEFEYVVKDKEGKNLTGHKEAADVNGVVAALRQEGLLIIRVTELKSKTAFFSKELFSQKHGGKVKIDDLVIFSRQLATMVEAGVPLVQSLSILGEQAENATLQRITANIRDEVEGGKSLSEALERHKKVFSNLFVSMVKAGESSGRLEEILDRLATYIEKTNALQKKIKSALVYPSVVSAMAVLITFGMMTWVIPQFAGIFTSLNAQLPFLTRVLIAVSDVMRHHVLLIIGATGGSIFLFLRFINTKGGRFWFDGVKLKMPIFGQLFVKVAISKFSRTLSTLVKSGVPILGALEIVGKTAGNVQIEKMILDVRNSIKEGESISSPLGRKKVFPPMVVRMIAVGEETGELDKMLSKISDFYDVQVDNAVDGLTALIEPLVIAFLGIVIGAIVIAMFLPILTLTQALQ